jgi:hypothetical protein
MSARIVAVKVLGSDSISAGARRGNEKQLAALTLTSSVRTLLLGPAHGHAITKAIEHQPIELGCL